MQLWMDYYLLSKMRVDIERAEAQRARQTTQEQHPWQQTHLELGDE